LGGCEALAAAAGTAAVWTAATAGAVWGGLELGKWLNKAFTPDQAAVIDIADSLDKEAGGEGISNEDADALLELAKESGLGKETRVDDDRDTDHWAGGSHIHIGSDHIKVKCE
jgi:hypothetical protein